MKVIAIQKYFLFCDGLKPAASSLEFEMLPLSKEAGDCNTRYGDRQFARRVCRADCITKTEKCQFLLNCESWKTLQQMARAWHFLARLD